MKLSTSLPARLFRAVLAVAIIAAGSLTAIVLPKAESASAAVSDPCDGSYTTNNLTVSPSHGKVFYIDTGQGQNIDASYVGYRVATSVNTSELWMRLDTFNGGVVALANPDDSVQQIGKATTSAPAAGFFLLKAPKPTTTAQTHVVSVFNVNPSASGATPVYQCTFTFQKVRETIKAAANKVRSISATNAGFVGGDLVVTHKGATGTIGAGSSPDYSMIWVSPASRSSWPTNALRLYKTTIEYFSNKTCNSGSLSVETNDLQLLNAGSTATKCYEANYYFRIIGQTSAVQVAPVAQISSGTQVKHTDMGSVAAANITVNTSTATVSSTLEKDPGASAPAVVNDSGTDYVQLNFKLKLTNTGTSTTTYDSIVDNADASLAFKSGSSSIATTGTATVPASVVPAVSAPSNGKIKLTFPGPFTLNAAATTTISYSMLAPCSGAASSYVNDAVAKIGSFTIGSSATQLDVVTSAVTTNTSTGCALTSSSQTSTPTTIPTEVVTGPATNVSTSGSSSSATIGGSIDTNGVTGQNFTCEYSTTNFGSSVSVAASPSTGSSSTAPTAVSCSLTSLTPGITYYYRVVATNGGTSTYGSIKTFDTPPVTSSTPTGQTLSPAGMGVDPDASNRVYAILNSNVNPLGNTVRVRYVYGLSSTTTCTSVTSQQTLSSIEVYEADNGSLSYGPLVLSGAYLTQPTFQLGGLSAGTGYCYKVLVDDDFNGDATLTTSAPTTATTGTGASTIDGGWVYFKAFSVNPPLVTTEPETSVTTNSATLNGTVEKGTNNANVQFCLTTTAPAAGSSTLTSCANVPSSPISVSAAGLTTVTHNATSLLASTTYYYQTVATDATQADLIIRGAIETFVTPGPPSATTGAASNINPTTATINGTANANGASTGVKFCYVAAANLAAADANGDGALDFCPDYSDSDAVTASPSSVTENLTSVGANLTGLTGGTLYFFQVLVNNTNGSARGAIMSFTTTVAPAAANTDDVQNLTNTAATLQGDLTAGTYALASANFCLATTSAAVLAGTCQTINGTISSATVNALATAGNITQAITGLTANTVYHYAIRATSNTSNAAVIGNVVSFRTKGGPGAITDLITTYSTTSATIPGTFEARGEDTEVYFCFTTQSAETGGKLDACLDVNNQFDNTKTDVQSVSGSADVPASTGVTPTVKTFAVSGLTNGLTYHYQAVAVNQYGTAFGIIRTFTPTATPPQPVTEDATSVTNNSAQLEGTLTPGQLAATASYCLSLTSSVNGSGALANCISAGAGTLTAYQASASGSAVLPRISFTGLTAGTTYHFQLIGTPSSGSAVYANVKSFTTADAPTVTTTNPATNITQTAADIAGTVNPNRAQATVTFCLSDASTTAGNGSLANCTVIPATQSPVSGSTSQNVSGSAASLTANTDYYFQTVASNTYGTRYGNVVTFRTASVVSNNQNNNQNNNGNNGNGGGNNSTPTPTPSVTPTPTPTATATPTPTPTATSTPRPSATPRPTASPSRTPATNNRPIALPAPTVATSPAPRVTPSPVASNTPAPALTPNVPLVKNITALINTVTKIVEKTIEATTAPQRSDSSTPNSTPSPSGSINGASEKVTTKVIEETAETVVTTEKVDGKKDVLSAATRTISEVAAEKVKGFAPGAGIRIEVIGSRITGQFVVAPGDAGDPLAIAKAIEESTERNRTDFASVDRVTQTTPPALRELFTAELTQQDIEIFSASGLAKPISLGELNFDNAKKWISVSASASTYLPGTVIYLTVTTQPIIFGAAVVDKYGKAKFSGKLPIDLLEQGGHSIRLVGIRSLDGISTDGNGELVLSDEAISEIQNFDDGTKATVILSGSSISGGAQTVVREVPLDRNISWWTVWLAGLVGLLSLGLRFIRRPVSAGRKAASWILAFAAGVPAAAAGWFEIAYELWIGVAIAAFIGAVNLLIGRRKSK